MSIVAIGTDKIQKKLTEAITVEHVAPMLDLVAEVYNCVSRALSNSR